LKSRKLTYNQKSALVVGRKVLDRFSRLIISYTPQLFRIINNIPTPWASCILLKFGNHRFLVTAAHAFYDYDKALNPKGIGITVNQSMLFPSGKMKITELVYEQNDKIDIAIIYLNDLEQIKQLESVYKFLDLKEVAFNHAIIPNQNYLIVGYPVTKTVVSKKYIDPKPCSFFNRTASTNVYKSLNVDEDLSVIFEYRKRKQFNITKTQITQGPNPIGLSGCGLWDFKISDGTRPKPLIRLMAIMFEWDKNRSILIGTRTKFLFPIIAAFIASDSEAINELSTYFETS